MKKKFLITTSIALIALVFTACIGETNASITLGNNMNTSLRQLSTTVQKLDTIDNSYISNSDILNVKGATLNQVPTPNSDPKSRVIALEDNLDINSILENELMNRLICDSDGNCVICHEKYICDDDHICNNCNQTINFDKNGNCNYCEKKLIMDDNNNCSKCKRNVITTKSNKNINDQLSKTLENVSNKNINVETELLSINNKDIEKLNTIAEDSIVQNNESNNLEDTSNSNDNNIIETENKNTNDSKNNIGFILYSEETFLPENLKYNPRYINNYDVNLANDQISRYINKIQKLYAISTDVLEANNTLSNYKITVLSNIDDTKELNDQIINGTCTPNEQQITALNNYISDLKTTIKNLKSCNGRLSNEINKIANNNSITNSIDVVNSNYVKILNHIDTRISYHENALATLEQIKYLINDAIANNNQSSNIVIDDNNLSLVDSNINDINKNDNVEEYKNSKNNETIIDLPKDENETTITNASDDNNTIDESTTTNNTNTDLVDESYSNDNTTNIYTDKNTNTDNANNTNQDVEINTTSDSNQSEQNNTSSTIDIEDDTTSNTPTNTIIDTYDDKLFESNIDTYNNGNIDATDNSESLINNTDVNSIIDNQDNIINNDNVNTLPNNNLSENITIDNNQNNNYENSIISESNLDNSNLTNNYYYENGNLYNKTNGYNSLSNENISNNKNNLNTYKYNTLIDNINRGTVNNGINTL